MDELQRRIEMRDASPEPQEVLTTPFTGFFTTLNSQAQDCFTSLPKGSISTFADLSKQFMSYFVSSIQKKNKFLQIEPLELGNLEQVPGQINVRFGLFHRDLERFAEADEEERGRGMSNLDSEAPTPRPRAMVGFVALLDSINTSGK
nr:uncharacterized protein LOC109184102 [Ipomoea batatas]